MDAGTFEGFSTTLEEPGILVVTFDRPETMNASTIGMKRDLVELLTGRRWTTPCGSWCSPERAARSGPATT